jgi:Tfp pilus assembly protein PilF
MNARSPARWLPAASVRWPALLCLFLVTACAFGIWYWSRGNKTVASTEDDPRLTSATPNRNVRPEVRYVGDAKCASCHAEIARSYARHPMGRSFAPLGQAVSIERYDRRSGNPFEEGGLLHLVERRGEQMVHKEIRSRSDGQSLAQSEAAITFVLGSGSRGRAYVINNDGYLFQSSLSWYVSKQHWALAPGYDENHRHFDRPITAECLSCHANRVQPVVNTMSRFREPIFNGYSIGCERCHGPGELHVASTDPLDIVNPAKLTPALRDAACEQCHLGGRGRILRHGQAYDDFRPGLPLHLFWAVFVKKSSLDDPKLLSTVEALHQSKCFRKSEGRLGCISCHDPHSLPEPDQRLAYYRGRCMQCHADKGCSLPLTDRRAKEDNCIACHMTSINPSDIAHVTISDHSIPRCPGALRETVPVGFPEDPLPLLHFHRDLLEPNDKGVSRELGIMLADVAREELDVEDARLALSLLDAAVKQDAKDVRALEAQAVALWLQGRHAEAMAAFEKALAASPEEETTLINAATLARRIGRTEQALSLWKRVLAVNPWPASYRYEMARVRAARSEWDQAIAECRTALRRNFAHLEARRLLVECLLRKKDRASAKAELDVLLGFDPPEPETLRRWFAEQVR